MHIEIDIIVLGIAIHIIWLMGLDKLGSLFLRKKKAMTGQYIFFLGLLTITGIFLKENYIVRAVIQQSLLVLFFFFIFCGNRWEKLGLSSILVAIWEFAWNGTDSVLSICTIIFANNKLLPFNVGYEPFITILSIAIPTVCIYLLFCRTKLAEGNFLHGSGKILFSVSCVLLVLIDTMGFGITQGIVMVSNGSGENYWNTTYNQILTHLEVLVLSALCIIICLSLLFGMNKLIGYLTIDKLHKMEISRYQELLKQYRKQANVRHDLKNHFISLSTLAEHEEWDKLKEYLLKLCNAGMIGEEDIETGNSVVNAIINTKKQTARQKNIKFDCNVTISRPLIMNEYDLCIIWGNLLDNAINAADISEEKYILVQAEIVKRNLIICVKNSMRSDRILDFKQKTFGIENWGTGLNNVNKIVQKENGIMDIEIKDSVFDISIMLPIASHLCHI